MGNLAIAALVIGIALFSGGKKAAPTAAQKIPGAVKIRIGPAKILPQKAPAKSTPKARVAIGPAKLTPVRAAVPTSVHDTTAVAVNAARPANGPPIPNEKAARAVAQAVADHYRANRKKYDHGRVSAFQAYAGLKPDGLYGPKTAQALRHYGALKVVG